MDVHSKNFASSWLLSLSVAHRCYPALLSQLLHSTCSYDERRTSCLAEELATSLQSKAAGDAQWGGGGNNATGLPDLNSRREQILTVTGWLFCSFIMSPTWTFIHLCSSNLEENGPCEFPQPSALTMRQNKAKETGKAKMDEDMSREGQLVLVACSGQSRTSSVSFDKSLSPVLSSVLQR